jgi:hypothetical protein
MKNLNEMNDQERLDLFAKMNSKELELLMHHASVELQERALVAEDELGRQTTEERKIWL